MKTSIWRLLSKLAEIDFKLQLLFVVGLVVIGFICAVFIRS